MSKDSDIYKYIDKLLTRQSTNGTTAIEERAKLRDIQNNHLESDNLQNEIRKWKEDKKQLFDHGKTTDFANSNNPTEDIANITANIIEGTVNTVIRIEEEREQISKFTKYDKLTLRYLTERDNYFVKRSIITMGWFQLWFLVHWVFHILSAFLAVGLFLDALTLHVKANIEHPKEGVFFHKGQMGFLFMLTAVHMFLLIYPCLRAASVTRTRQRVIRKISQGSYKYFHIPSDVLDNFIKSMKEQNFSFRLCILCANVTFNLNVAYISIIFGFIGVVVSLVTTLTA